MFPPNLSNRTKRRFGVDVFPAAATELGSGQPFLRFFPTVRDASGACSRWNRKQGGEGMIRNDKEYRHSKNPLSELGAGLQRGF